MVTRFPMMLMAATTLATTVAAAPEASARPRPPAFFPAPLVAPGSVWLLPRGVYYARPDGRDVFFEGGWWWAPWEGGWYRSAAVEGPWSLVPYAMVPRVVIGYPGHVHRYLPRAQVIPFRPWRDAGYGPGWRTHRDGARDHRWDRPGRGQRGDRYRAPRVVRPAPRDRDGRLGRDQRGKRDGRGPDGRPGRTDRPGRHR